MIAPERREAIMRDVQERNKERLQEALTNALGQGLFLWRREPPRSRLRAYMVATLADELPFVLDAAYLPLMKTGYYPPLRSPFWAALLALPDFVFERFASDFRSLFRALAKKREEDARVLPP